MAYGFQSVCYDLPIAAQQAACNATDYWNNIPGQSVSCLSFDTMSTGSLSTFHLMSSDGSVVNHFDRIVNFAPCASFANSVELWSYIFASIVGLYLTTRMISVIIRMIK